MRIGPWVGRLMAAFIGVVMIGAAELVLRQVPSLQTPPFTIKVASVGQRVLRTINPDYARRFFSGVSVAGMRMTPHPYLVPAPVPTLRVVVAGGSTVQGYPHPRLLTFSAYLQAMLEDALPNHTVEVFNIGITAISSFAVAQAVEGPGALAQPVKQAGLAEHPQMARDARLALGKHLLEFGHR